VTQSDIQVSPSDIFVRMRTVVKKWGNSAAVRIPSGVMQAAGLALEDGVDVRAQSGRIVIEPVRRRMNDLGDMLKQINAKNRHTSVDFGAPAGKEVW
jgi:antitoxin MazE